MNIVLLAKSEQHFTIYRSVSIEESRGAVQALDYNTIETHSSVFLRLRRREGGELAARHRWTKSNPTVRHVPFASPEMT